MNKDDLKKKLLLAAQSGSLMTPKHDPGNLHIAYDNFRSVLSHHLASNLESFIESQNYDIKEYENKKRPVSPVFIEIIPHPNSGFRVPASGVAANSLVPTERLNRLVAVSGSKQGWHLYGESDNTILQRILNGELEIKDEGRQAIGQGTGADPEER